MLKDGKDQGEVRKALYILDPTFSWSKPTFYDHKRHITHPLITAQKAALMNPTIVPQTNRGFLEAVRDIGIRKAIDNPESVTIDHGLKAVSIMESNKKPIENVFILIAKEMANPDRYRDAIEGEFEVIEEEANG